MASYGSKSLEELRVHFLMGLISIHIFGYCFSLSIGKLNLREQLAMKEFHSIMNSRVILNANVLTIKVTVLNHSQCVWFHIVWSSIINSIDDSSTVLLQNQPSIINVSSSLLKKCSIQ
jgi:hypothetical protein